MNAAFHSSTYVSSDRTHAEKHYFVKMTNIAYTGLHGVLLHSVKQRILPQDKSLRERVEKSC
jgi:hypothetical protein